MIFAILVSPLSFAESEDDDGGFFGKKLTELFKWAPNAIGDGLNGIGPSAEEIYMPGSPYYFSFSTDNVFGLFTSKAYPLFKLIAVIMISPLLSFYGIGLMRASSGIGKKTSLDAIVTLVLSVGVLWFLPDIVNFIFGMKDSIAQGVNQVFVSNNNAGFVEEMRQLSETGGILDALIFLAAVVFSYWLMANYVGLSFGFAVLLLYTPVALIISSASNMRKISGELSKTLWGYVLTPIFDISLLGIVTITRGVDPSAFGIDPLMYNIMSIVLVMSVIPARSFIKRLFGFGSMFGDMLGVGMIAGVAGMALRGAKGKSKSSSVGGSSGESRSREDVDNNGRASYYDDLAQMEKQKQDPGTEVGFYDPANESLPPLKEMTRDDFLQKHQGQSYFNERDLGGLSNQEKADYYKSQSNLDELKMREDRKDRIKSGALGVGKGVLTGGVKGYTSVIGASAGMFMGPAGAAAGGMLGYKLGEKITNSGNAIKKTASWGKDVYDESSDVIKDSGISSKISSRLNFKSQAASEAFDKVFDSSIEDQMNETIQFEAMNFESSEQPGISRTAEDLELKGNIHKAADNTKHKSNQEITEMMNRVKEDFRVHITDQVASKVADTGDYASASKLFYEAEIQIKSFDKGANKISSSYAAANEAITRDLKFTLEDHVFQNDKSINPEFMKRHSSEIADKRKAAFVDSIDTVSSETGIDYKSFISEQFSKMS